MNVKQAWWDIVIEWQQDITEWRDDIIESWWDIVIEWQEDIIERQTDKTEWQTDITEWQADIIESAQWIVYLIWKLLDNCGVGSVKVNYYRCMMKIGGLVKHSIVKWINSRWDYHTVVFVSAPFATWKKTNKLTQIKLLQAKIGFRIHTQWFL